jgi:hypothetical protein
LVYQTYGVGDYTIVADLDIIGNTTTSTSRSFRLMVYSDIAANGTVRIESTQNGNIFGNDFDFTDLDWYQSLRVKGTFGNPKPILETTEYVDSNQTRTQNKASMEREWSLVTGLLSWEVVDKLIYNKLLGNSIEITDYNIKAESLWRRVPVFIQGVEKPDISGTPNKRYNVTFIDEQKLNVKRNF